MVDRTRYALSEPDNERIFRDRIVPDELVGTPQSRPVVVVFDTYEPHHPRYHELVAEDDSTAGVYTSIDGHKWMEKAEAYAISQRFDVVMESAMRDPRDFEEPARRFKAAGYQVEVAIVAVNRPRGRD